ncbi:MAG: hypothetical protein ACJ8EL_03595 [Rhizomicrobium sp.]
MAPPSVSTISPTSPNESGIGRPTVYRAFTRGPKHPNLKTVLSVLDAMGFQLHVTVRRNARARLARPKASLPLNVNPCKKTLPLLAPSAK